MTTKLLIVDYVIERNSQHEAKKISLKLSHTAEGLAVGDRILPFIAIFWEI